MTPYEWPTALLPKAFTVHLSCAAFETVRDGVGRADLHWDDKNCGTKAAFAYLFSSEFKETVVIKALFAIWCLQGSQRRGRRQTMLLPPRPLEMRGEVPADAVRRWALVSGRRKRKVISIGCVRLNSGDRKTQRGRIENVWILFFRKAWPPKPVAE